MNQIKLNKFRLNKRQKNTQNQFNLMKEIRVNKYIKKISVKKYIPKKV